MIKVNLLGNFEIQNEYGKMSQAPTNSRKTKMFISYLIINKNKICTKEEIMDALWQDDECINLTSSLKTVVHRARTLLERTLGKEEYITVYKGVGYRWNPLLETEVDIEVFERSIKEAEDSLVPMEEKIMLYEKAVSAYGGDFIAGEWENHWVIAWDSYYRVKMLKCINILAEFYIDKEEFNKADEVCMIGFKHHFVDETLYYNSILSKVMQGNYKEAQEVYEKGSRLLKIEFETEELEKLQTLRSLVMGYRKVDSNENIEKIQKDMQRDVKTGAFICSYPVFCEIYRLECRKRKRLKGNEAGNEIGNDVSDSIMMVNVNVNKRNVKKTQKEKDKQIADMKAVENVILYNIRTEDVVSQYNDYQYIVLLYNCTVELCRRVGERIKERIKMNGIDAEIEIECRDYLEIK